MMNGKKTVELSLKELFIVLLRKWFVVFVCVVISGVVFGLKTYFERRDAFKDTYRRYQVSLSTYNQEVFATEEAIRYNTLKGNAQDAAAKNSVLMKVDPFNARMAHITFVVNAEGAGNMDSVNRNIVNVYRTLIASAPIQEVYKGVDLSKYTDESLVGLVYIVEPEKGTVAPVNLINVDAIGNEDIDPMRILQNLSEYLGSKSANIAMTTAAHQFTSIGARTAYELNDNLSLLQSEKRASVKEATKTIKDLEDDLAKIRGRKPKSPSLLRQIAKQGMIAAFVTAIIVAFILVLIYVIQIKIQTGEQIQNQLGIRYLGGGLYKKKRFIGRWGDILSGTVQLSSENTIKNLVQANIKEVVSGKYDTVLVTGTIKQKELDSFLNSLVGLTADIKTKLIAKADVVNNYEAVEALEKVQAVIFVERIDYSRLKQVGRSIERVHQSGKKVIGYTIA